MEVVLVNAIDRLEKAKSDIIYDFNMINKIRSFDEERLEEENDNFKNARIILKQLAKEKNKTVPSFIGDCRTVEEASTLLLSEMDINENNNSVVRYVNSIFNDYIDFLEDKEIDVQIIKVECEVPESLTFEHILEAIDKCEKRIETGDYSGAATSAKTLVEGTCKEILNKFSDDSFTNNTNLPEFFTKVRHHLNLDPSDPKLDKVLKEIITSLIKIVTNIAVICNKYGDKHLTKNKIDRHHALVVVNSAKTIVTFLFNSYEYQLERGTLKVEIEAK